MSALSRSVAGAGLALNFRYPSSSSHWLTQKPPFIPLEPWSERTKVTASPGKVPRSSPSPLSNIS